MFFCAVFSTVFCAVLCAVFWSVSWAVSWAVFCAVFCAVCFSPVFLTVPHSRTRNCLYSYNLRTLALSHFLTVPLFLASLVLRSPMGEAWINSRTPTLATLLCLAIFFSFITRALAHSRTCNCPFCPSFAPSVMH